MIAWQRLISLWRTNSPPQLFFYCQRIALISRIYFLCNLCNLLTFIIQWHEFNEIISFIRFIRWLPFIVDFCHLMTRITRISFSCHLMNRMNLMDGAMCYLVNLINLVIIFQIFFVSFVLSVDKIITCCWINFCPQKSKTTNSRNSLIIIDITSYIPIKSPKIHWKSLLLYINFANFLSYPLSKIPDPNDVVSSINAYGVNSWHLIGYEGKEKQLRSEKTL